MSRQIKFVLATHDDGFSEYLAIVPTAVNPGKCMTYGCMYKHSTVPIKFLKQNCKAVGESDMHNSGLRLLIDYMLMDGYTVDDIPTQFRGKQNV